MLKINIEQIKEDLGAMMEVEETVELENKEIRGQEINFIAPCELELMIINSEDEYVVTGQGELSLRVNCTRCLDLFDMPLTFKFETEVAKEELENDKEIDLSDSLWEQIRVNLPMKTVCQDDCQGLCPSCGADLNHEECDCYKHELDPRMAKLGQLLDEE
jgi:uncharacterized protein